MKYHLHHLVSLEHMDQAQLMQLIARAQHMREASCHGTRQLNLLQGRTVLNLFFEPSTRTRTSFELAARRLGAHVVNFNIAQSSTNKGETIADTLHNLEAMHLDILIVRHKENGTPDMLIRNAMSGVSIVNAGDGTHAHPTQGLLDAWTIHQQKPDAAALSVTICGDIQHSRVARSDIRALRTLGVRDIRLAGPRAMLPDSSEFPGCTLTENFDDAVRDANVIIMLRLQKERMHATELPNERVYYEHYGLTAARLATAAPKCMVMHPGPINRGIEIASDVADGPQSFILRQAGNGVFMRMAVLAEVLSV